MITAEILQFVFHIPFQHHYILFSCPGISSDGEGSRIVSIQQFSVIQGTQTIVLQSGVHHFVVVWNLRTVRILESGSLIYGHANVKGKNHVVFHLKLVVDAIIAHDGVIPIHNSSSILLFSDVSAEHVSNIGITMEFLHLYEK